MIYSKFSAHAPSLPGCASVGETPREIMNNIKESINLHLQGILEDGDQVPKSFQGDFDLTFKFDTMTLLQYYKGVFSAVSFERLTGINQKQILHYSSGLRKPRDKQKKKIESALHQLGAELMAVEL